MVERQITMGISQVEVSPTSLCSECSADLVLHQPDSDLPDRLIATCGGCRTWFLLYTDIGVHIRLPSELEIEPS
jgi:hypothetical protein